jgi:hypothetical protein
MRQLNHAALIEELEDQLRWADAAIADPLKRAVYETDYGNPETDAVNIRARLVLLGAIPPPAPQPKPEAKIETPLAQKPLARPEPRQTGIRKEIESLYPARW